MTGLDKDDVYDMSVKFQNEWMRLRKHYGGNIVLANLHEADILKHERWGAQSSLDKTERAEATKDVLRCGFTYKVFQMLKVHGSAAKVKNRLFFESWQMDYLRTFGELMGDVPRTLIRQGEWWKKEPAAARRKI